ncbi:MAG TPA: patatin-like phospholipase family protein [Gemmatimonadales bacterium]
MSETSTSTSTSQGDAAGAGTPRIALVLGGGGLKGFAHIGVLQALEERGITPSVYAGTSIGALMATAHAFGVSTAEMADRAERLRRRDLFRINHVGMIVDRMRSASLYLEEPLRDLVRSVVPRRRLNESAVPTLVSTVDLERGTQVVWGLPGLDDVWADDAVYASCSLPGFFPPGRVKGRSCVDGGVVDNLPVAFPRVLGADVIIAVDVGSTELAPAHDVAERGFAAIFMRAATTMMSKLQGTHLAQRRGIPTIYVRPPITGLDWFTFGQARELVEIGRRAAEGALDALERGTARGGGLLPRRPVRLEVDRRRCIGCGICVALSGGLMELDGSGKAVPPRETQVWSPADGEFVRHCPTEAITVHDMGDPAMGDWSELAAPQQVRRPRIRRSG